ncbi:kinase-like domain-containing protein [Mycotypha africana]|uniref:kinase-like domain-containing protein n=1 Tax=Mycotypha africana TaxID=64632 RepID=UPI002301DA4B|nr:kinase-like domain-containing protein [Mycotypha africana]KAI8979123.1 kinase-like domain-containing protein [Mycotypha africana]
MTAEKSGQTPTHSPQLECEATPSTASPILPKPNTSIPLSTAIATAEMCSVDNKDSNQIVRPAYSAAAPLPAIAVDKTTVPDICTINRPFGSSQPNAAIISYSALNNSANTYTSHIAASTDEFSKYFRQNVCTSTTSSKQQGIIVVKDSPTPPPSTSPPLLRRKSFHFRDANNKTVFSSTTSNNNMTVFKNKRLKKIVCLHQSRGESNKLLKSAIDNTSIHKTYIMMPGTPAKCTRSKRKIAELDYELNCSNIATNICQATGGSAKKIDPIIATVKKSQKMAEKHHRQQLRQQLKKEKGKSTASGSNKTKSSKTIITTSKRRQPKLKQKASSTEPCDDENGHLVIKPNESVTPRWQGTFGRVVECYDREKREYVAIKIGRAIPKFRKACLTEIRILQKLKKSDPHNYKGCIHLQNHFDFKNHICMVFDLLGDSLYDYMKGNNYRPFPMHHIQSFGKQLLTSVAHLHDLALIHTDLKPENILLVDHTSKDGRYIYGQDQYRSKVLCSTNICLIDFGSAIFDNEHHASTVTTRHYRAPEIILKHGWSFPCDIWSLGCIFFELMTGEALFQTHDDLEHLAMMARAIGDIPKKFVQRTFDKQARDFFFLGKLNYPNHDTSQESIQNVQDVRYIEDIINPETDGDRLFVDLIFKMLCYEPYERISAKDALKHPFFDIKYDEGSGIELKKGDL